MRTALLATALLALAGCGGTTSVANLFRDNEAAIAALAIQASTVGCASTANALKPDENVKVCSALQSCAVQFCVPPAARAQ